MSQGNAGNTSSQNPQSNDGSSSHTKVVDRSRVPRQVHARQIASKVARTYQKADAHIVGAAKKAVPQKTLHQLAANRAQNNGNVRVRVPISRKRQRQISFTVPQALGNIRHAALPLAIIIMVSVFALAGASPPSYISTKQIGGLGVEKVVQIIRDNGEGNEYIVGTFQGTVNFGADWSQTDTKTSAGGTDIFVTRINNDGSYGWTKHFGGVSDESVVGVSLSSNGVFVAGTFSGVVDFRANEGSPTDTKTSAGGTDGFVVAIGDNGGYQSVRQIGGTGTDVVESISTYGGFGAIITGSFTDTVDFGADWGQSDIKTSAGGTDGFVLSIDENSDYQWAKRFGGSGADTATSAQDTGYDGVRITGSFTDTVDFGADWGEADSKTSAGGTDGFILSASGDAYSGTKQFGSTGSDSGSLLRLDENSNMYVAGSFTDTVDFGADWGETDSKTSSSGTGAAIFKINQDGSYVWARQIGSGGGSVSIHDLVTDQADVYLAGSFTDTVDFAQDAGFGSTDEKTTSGTSGGYITKISDAGGYHWTKVVTPSGGSDAVAFNTLDIDTFGNKDISIAGSFSGTSDFAEDFDATDAKVASGTDGFITKIATRVINHTVGDAAGLTFKDENGVNLSSTGSAETNPTVYVHNQSDDTLIATIGVDLSEDRDWSTVSGENDTIGFKSIIHDAIGAPGAANAMTLYVPKESGDTAVALCPNATALSEVTANCVGKLTLTDGSENVSTATIEGVEYWVVENITDQKIGGMSVDRPKVLLSETDDSTVVTEGGATDFIQVRLDARPAEDVTVQIMSDPANQLADPGEVVFTSANWDTPVLVEVAAVDDNDIEGNHVATLGYSAASNDAVYDGATETGLISVAITDNDTAGVTISAESNLVSENGTTVEICAVLTARPKHAVTLQFASSNSSEVAVGSSLTIQPNNWNNEDNCVTATGVDDDEVDGPQNATLRVSGISSDDTDFAGVQADDISTLQITNQDNDTAAFIVSASDTETTEAGGSVEVCVTLTARPTSNVTIPVSVSDTTEATLGAVTTLVITPSAWNSANNCVTVTGVDDDIVDGDIAYDFITGDPTSSDAAWNDLGANDIANQSLTNLDNDEAGVVLAGTETVAVTEGGATDAFSVVLRSESIDDSQVVVRVAPNAQLDIGEGAGTAKVLTFTSENWSQPQEIMIQAVDDEGVEGDHAANIVVSIDEETTEPSYIGLTGQAVSVAITDNDIAAATITTVTDASEQPETNGRFRVALDHTNNTGADMTLSYTVSGTAVSDQHYTALSGSVVIADGEDSAEIIVSVAGRDNELLEGDKSVIVTLTSSDSELATIGDPAAATLMIFDDERGEISLATTQHGTEENETSVVYTATLNTVNNTGGDISMYIHEDGGTATADEDYQSFDGAVLVIPDGAATGTVTVGVIDDDVFEAETETVRASIDTPSITGVTIDEENDTADATITDNDMATIGFAATNATANEHPSSNGTIRISLDKPNNTGEAVQVSYTVSGTATADSDFETLSGNVTIPSGQQHADITIDTEGFDDDDMEGNETVILTHATNTLPARVSVGENSAAQVTIVDDEIAGITVTSTDDTTSEDGDTGQICATLASRPSDDVTILLASEDSSKLSVTNTLTIERDNWNTANENCVTVTGHDDTPAAATGMQSIVIRTTGVETDDPFYAALTADDMQDITIQHADNDSADVSVTSVSTVTSENGEKSAVVRFRLQTMPSDEVVIPLEISDETEGSISQSQVTIAPSDWNTPENNEVVISGVDDYLTDGNIDYTLVTGDPVSDDAAYNDLSASDVANVQLLNEDDDEAGVTLTNGSAVTVTEGGASSSVGLRLESQPANGNRVVVRAVPADIQVDLGAGAGVAVELAFDGQNWQTEQQVSVVAFDDDLLEGDHSSAVQYEIDANETTEQAYVEYGLDAVTNVTIADNDTATATLALSDGNETGPTAMTTTVTLSKENNTGAPITLKLDPDGGTATADSDYADFADTTISIADGASSASAAIPVIDDNLMEGDETVEAIVSGVNVPFVSLVDAQQSATIIDNDTATATIAATTPTAYEHPAQAGEFTVYLSRTNNTGAPISVVYDVSGTATSDADYAALSGSVVIPHGSNSATINVATTGHNDSQVEGNETVVVTLQSVDHPLVSIGGPSSATVTIVDDDGFTFSMEKTQDGDENGANITFRVRLSQVNTTGNPVSVDISDTGAGTATAGEDYQNFGGTVTIPNGQQYADYAVTIMDDADLEDAQETVEARIANQSEGEIGVANATAYITDNETGSLTIEATADAAENPSTNGVFTISLDKVNHGTQPVTLTYTINGTATAGEDYAPLSGHAMIAVGQDETVVTVDTDGYNDEVYEGSETVIVTLSGADHPNVTIGNPYSATVMIADDDPEPSEGGDNGDGETPSENGNAGSSNSDTAAKPLRQNTVYVPVKREAIERASSESSNDAIEAPKPQPVDQKVKDTDNDGTPDEEENKAHNHGDGNGDGIPDSKQSNVASLVSTVTNSPVTLEAHGNCSDITKFKIVAEDSLAKQDKRHSYPYGLADFKIGCEESGDKSMIAVYYDRALSTDSNWRKFSGSSEQFATMNFVQNVRKPVGTSNVTAVQYTIKDGDESDSDGKANGEIVDPAGFAKRSFYILDLGWLLPVIIAGGFVGYAVWHRVRNHRKYAR